MLVTGAVLCTAARGSQVTHRGRVALEGCRRDALHCLAARVEGSQQPLSHLFPFSLPPEPSGSSSSSFYLTLP